MAGALAKNRWIYPGVATTRRQNTLSAGSWHSFWHQAQGGEGPLSQHEFYRDFITDRGEPFDLSAGTGDPLARLARALGGQRLQAVAPRCTCGWRGRVIDRRDSDPNSGHPDRDAFSQWFLTHMPEALTAAE